MAKLAIKGHPTRGKEIIEILEILGGINRFDLKGTENNSFYYIFKNNNIHIIHARVAEIDNLIIFTLEEFKEKFPYKVGDRVSSKYLKNYKIEKMEWRDTDNKIIYKLQGMGWYNVDELCPYKEETMEEKSVNHVYSISTCKTIGQGTYAIKIADGYKFDRIDENSNIIVKSIKPQYPKTYKECCNILGFKNRNKTEQQFLNSCDLYDAGLMTKLSILKVCRDTYRKIAGEEMGLGKPWEPDWSDDLLKYYISFYSNEVDKGVIKYSNKFLVFPTEEMRDAFYENFKELIEQCKELL